MKFVAAFLLLLGLEAALLLGFIYSGRYNVAAGEPHAAVVARALGTLRTRSIQAQARDLQAPPLDDPALIRSGFHHFQEMCVTCHGAPGVEPSEIGRGLNPDPPDLSRMARTFSPAELFWIVKHGVKMTGMPAFGLTHTDRELWGIVAFLERLPGITPQEYLSMTEVTQRGEGTHPHGMDRGNEGGEQHGGSAAGATHEHSGPAGQAHEHDLEAPERP